MFLPLSEKYTHTHTNCRLQFVFFLSNEHCWMYCAQTRKIIFNAFPMCSLCACYSLNNLPSLSNSTHSSYNHLWQCQWMVYSYTILFLKKIKTGKLCCWTNLFKFHSYTTSQGMQMHKLCTVPYLTLNAVNMPIDVLKTSKTRCPTQKNTYFSAFCLKCSIYEHYRASKSLKINK